MNQGKLQCKEESPSFIEKQTLQKYKYDNHMQIMLMNINDVTI